MNLKSLDVQIVSNEKQLNDAFNIRKTVFVIEQQVPPAEEIDDLEPQSTHFILYIDEKPAGAGRYRTVDGYGKVERICVLKDFRGMGAGQAIMEKIATFAKEKGIKRLKLNAQTHAIPFYSKLGYQVVSDEFLDAGIPHKTMIKEI
ncbi:GNAT family N-acetyltransferase [Bacillus tuaregi]|uniref:GNAT family N-acetyltransferase n=1 Tax=Bacillus tuaregi TaxID=1816695 RepID=UPI0008F907E7|nr:GNAT family N-acetyltransferase [Bacillus tuaregi]